MEENKKTELEEQTNKSPVKKKQNIQKRQKLTQKIRTQILNKSRAPAGNFGLMLLAGVYLVIHRIPACKDVLTGVEGASVGFLAAGVAFLVIGGVIFIKAAKISGSGNRQKRLRKQRKWSWLHSRRNLRPQDG